MQFHHPFILTHHETISKTAQELKNLLEKSEVYDRMYSGICPSFLSSLDSLLMSPLTGIQAVEGFLGSEAMAGAADWGSCE